MTDSKTLQAVVDRQAITNLIYRYCRAVDRLDRELGYSIWHDDGLAEYEGFYSGTGRGFIDAVCEAHKKLVIHSHQVTNIIIDLDGDRASSEAYVTATLWAQDGAHMKRISVWGRYLDRWSRRNGLWGIDKRIEVNDFDEFCDVLPRSNYPKMSRRDREDPSYTVFNG